MAGDLLSMVRGVARSEVDSRFGDTGGIDYTSNISEQGTDNRVSLDSTERWFLWGISAWGADSEGNADVVSE